ncbi:MAG: hypothetical protein JNK38_01340 [Acidobacteria bacterium]|nr:hypothetical protein [Acidobacteriota bacterium]
MRKLISIIFLLSVVALFAVSAQAQSKAAPAFDKLKALAGEWQGKTLEGTTGKVNYRIASGGSAVIETLMPANEPEMVSVYHRDGDSLVLTHYCSAGNQPRMRAEVPTGDINKLEFKFVDATNLKHATDGHINHMTITFQDKDHITVVWVWREKGKEVPMTINLERKK